MSFQTLAWKTLAKLRNKNFDEMPIVLENVQFHRATIMPKEGTVKFLVNIFDGTGDFEICEGGTLTVSGKIYEPENVDKEQLDLAPPQLKQQSGDILPLQPADIYKDLRLIKIKCPFYVKL